MQIRKTSENANIEFSDMLALFIGSARLFSIDVGSALILGEFAAILATIVHLKTSIFLFKNRSIKILGATWLIWIFAQAVSDTINGTDFSKTLRLQLSIFALFPALIGITALLIRRPGSIYWLCAGTGISAILSIALPSTLSPIVRWKWGAAGGASLAVCGISSWLISRRYPHRKLASGLLLSAGVLGFLTDARSLSGFLIFLGLIVAVRTLLNSIPRESPARPTIAIFTTVLVIVAPIAIYQGYSLAAQRGLLGELATARYNAQSTGGLSPLILARSESVGSLLAIRDKPMWGHGAWAEDSRYIQAVALLHRRLGYADPTSRLDVISQTGGVLLIPIHSMVLGAWVWGGVFCTLIFIIILSHSISNFVWALGTELSVLPVLGFSSIQLIWAVPFSPFSSTNRIDLEIMLAIVLYFQIRRSGSNYGAG